MELGKKARKHCKEKIHLTVAVSNSRKHVTGCPFICDLDHNIFVV